MRSFSVRVVLAALAPALCAPSAEGKTIDCFQNVSANCTDVAPRALPTSVDEFLKLREELAKTPEGAAMLFLFAAMVRLQNKDLGDQLLVLAVTKSKLRSGKVYKGYALGSSARYLVQQMDRHPHCIRSYASSSNPENGYKLDPAQVGFKMRKQTRFVGSVESGRYKVFVCSSGTSTCRPMTLRRNDAGVWKADEFSSFAVGCRAPSGGDAPGAPAQKTGDKDDL
jgi:hypothetical protein